MLRIVLILVLFIVIARAFWRVVDGVIEGMGGTGSSRGTHMPARGVQMERDPVCGTYVVPERAIALVDRGRRVYFCSTACRDKYRP